MQVKITSLSIFKGAYSDSDRTLLRSRLLRTGMVGRRMGCHCLMSSHCPFIIVRNCERQSIMRKGCKTLHHP